MTELSPCPPCCKWACIVGGLPACEWWEHHEGLRPCPGGADCTVYEPSGRKVFSAEVKKKKTPKPRKERKRKINFEAARKLYDQGLNDREISMQIGVSDSSVARWRNAEGLPPQFPRRAQKFSREEARKLHALGLTDAEIGATLGMKGETIKKWRQSAKLPANKKKGGF